MNFKKWLQVQETMTSTSCIAGFSRIALPLQRRVWPMHWGQWHDDRKKKKKPLEQPQVKEVYDSEHDDSADDPKYKNKNMLWGHRGYQVRRDPDASLKPQQPYIPDPVSYRLEQEKRLQAQEKRRQAAELEQEKRLQAGELEYQKRRQFADKFGVNPNEPTQMMLAALNGLDVPDEYASEGTRVAKSVRDGHGIPAGTNKSLIVQIKNVMFHKKFGFGPYTKSGKSTLEKFGYPAQNTFGQAVELAISD